MKTKDISGQLLQTIAGITEEMSGAYSLRSNGQGVRRGSSEHIQVRAKTDKPGIDIIVAPGTKNEKVHIPVIITESGVNDLVYNDFIIGEGADIEIIAGCAIHNDGDADSEHDGIHTFRLGKNSKLKYTEKHYGEGSGTGERLLNPTTILYMEENSVCEMELTQIEGVNSTLRETDAHLGKGSRLIVTEKLMTHDRQTATSNMKVSMDADDASAQIISRSVAKDSSVQVFHPIAVGNAASRAHVQCDAIIMDSARVRSIPEIEANHADAQIVHEAAIGRINNEQLVKLETLGMDEAEAEQVIIDAFLL